MKGAAKLPGGLFDVDGGALWDMMPFLMELSGAQTQNAKVNFEVERRWHISFDCSGLF
jgi:hypothetical protein